MKTKEISYASNQLTADQKKNYKRAIVISQDGLVYLFPNSAATVAIISPRQVYNDYDAFEKAVTDAELVTLHNAVFGKEPTAKEVKDRVELSVKVWMRMCETALQRLDAKVAGERKSSPKLANRGYEVLKTEVPAEMKLPPQAKVCLAFFAECVAELNRPVGDDSVPTITEAKFNEYVIANQKRLNTRQDPWRIFQYYRPQLIQGNFIRLV